MPSEKCKGVTKFGERCKRDADSFGYCYIHDPKIIAKREAQNQSLQIRSEFEMPIRSFSERRGLKPVSEIIQVNEISQDLRHSLWNTLNINFLLQYSSDSFGSEVLIFNDKYVSNFITRLWTDFFKRPLDDLPKHSRLVVQGLRKWFDESHWYEVYDFLEITINYFESRRLVEDINAVLNRELSGFRFVGGVLTDITTEQEIEMLEEALTDRIFSTVSSHLKRALALMSDRENPDYRNSIKESISAVESLAKTIAGKPKATLGEALKVLEVSNKVHPALKDSFLKLYGYTSDEGGIRHAMLIEPNLTSDDARFFLLSCTSFINYLKSKI
jgi:hypothetical protein